MSSDASGVSGRSSVMTVAMRLSRAFRLGMRGRQRRGSCVRRDGFRLAIEAHEVHPDRELRMLREDLPPKLAQLRRMHGGFLGAVLGEVLAEDDFEGAAVAMVEQDDLVDGMQVDGDAEMLPEGLVP